MFILKCNILLKKLTCETAELSLSVVNNAKLLGLNNDAHVLLWRLLCCSLKGEWWHSYIS